MRSTFFFSIICKGGSILAIPLALTGVALGGSGGTSLMGTKTASATIAQTETYNWSITKTTPTTSPYSIGIGAAVQVPFTITVNRTGPTLATSNGPISGNVCLNNTGATASTSGLFATDQLEYYTGTNWAPFGTGISLPIAAELSPLQSQCYPYQFTSLSLSAQTQYRNHAIATIDNFLGFEGTPHPVDILAPVSITLTNQTVDASANLTDIFQCPTGFTCTPSGPTLTLSGTQTINYTVTITNNAAAC
ncbi:hypothetical protein WDW37_04820 [Bdellovibrionota bacterium FG-1]